MINSHIADLHWRTQKCGNQLNNNKQDDDYSDDDTASWSDEAQSTRKRNKEHHSQTIVDSQRTGMSTPSKTLKAHRSSLSDCLDEDLDSDNGIDNTMWRNEIQQNDDFLPEEQSEQINTNRRRRYGDLVDIVLRMVIVVIFIKLETMSPFKREIHPEELWLYKNPRRPDIVRADELLFLVIAVPLFVTLIFYAFSKDRRDFRAASWAWTMAVCMNSIPTSLLKNTVGRPRPDFFYRCFPDGVMVLNETADALNSVFLDFNCTGNPRDINEGRKSFPSGHSSFAFASFGFVSYYVGAKLHAFDARGRGHTWRLCLAVMPLIVAALVAVSRTCDYHHHWQDVTVGALIGLFTGYYSYRQYYPSIFSTDAGTPFVRWQKKFTSQPELKDEDDGDVIRPLLGKQSSKWH